MDIFIIAFASAAASLLTFFSGFGLGTILTPVFVVFFPVEIAIALTGIVHLLNNFFKIILVGKYINLTVALKFGITAVVGAFAGAKILFLFADSSALYTYTIHNKLFSITYLKLIIAVLMIVFTMFEIIPSLKKIQFNKDKLYLGGLISGFIGGLSGNQGALRSMFLIRVGLTKEKFIATGILIACFVDVTRLSIYFSRISVLNISDNLTVLLVAVGSAFAGAYIGCKLLKKMQHVFIQNLVTIMIILLSICLGSGLL